MNSVFDRPSTHHESLRSSSACVGSPSAAPDEDADALIPMLDELCIEPTLQRPANVSTKNFVGFYRGQRRKSPT
jgi:hypothetical protein